MTDLATLESLSGNSDVRTENYLELLPEFYAVATGAYMNNWGNNFHLPPFAPGQTLEEACKVQEGEIASNFKAGQKILDLGCGVGGPARNIASFVPGLHITGCNIVPDQIALATKMTAEAGLSSQVDFAMADFAALPFEDNSFDGAYSFDALCHSPNKAVSYKEIHRVLKPGSTFTGADWFYTNGLSAEKYARWIEPLCHYSALPSLLSPNTAAALLAEAGFEVEYCIDLAESENLDPNWDIFDDLAMSIASYTDSMHQFMYYHATTCSLAGRADTFTIGAWKATVGEKNC